METRIDRLRGRLPELELDAYVSLWAPDNQYLTGFVDNQLFSGVVEPTSAVIVTEQDAIFACDFRNTEHAEAQVRGALVEQWSGNLFNRLGKRLTDIGLKTVGFDPARLSVAEHADILETFTGTLDPVKGVVSALRVVKEADEIAAIRAASELSEAVLAEIVDELVEGVTEREVASRLTYEYKRRGAYGSSFEPIVLFGPRSSLPHGEAGDRRLSPGDIVLVDTGVRMGGYASDLTRTFVYGTIVAPWFSDIYETTRAAQAAALEAVRPGVACSEVDAVARTMIADAGYGEQFGHGLGHGVGVEVHEAPRLNAESTDVLQEGMVVTVEPGIYLPGQGGVRIEDLVVVTAQGCDVMTQLPKALKVVSL